MCERRVLFRCFVATLQRRKQWPVLLPTTGGVSVWRQLRGTNYQHKCWVHANMSGQRPDILETVTHAGLAEPQWLTRRALEGYRS